MLVWWQCYTETQLCQQSIGNVTFTWVSIGFILECLIRGIFHSLLWFICYCFSMYGMAVLVYSHYLSKLLVHSSLRVLLSWVHTVTCLFLFWPCCEGDAGMLGSYIRRQQGVVLVMKAAGLYWWWVQVRVNTECELWCGGKASWV